MLPLVSIAIPTYNRPNGLRKALECLVNQTYKNIQVVIGDNSDIPNHRIVYEFDNKIPIEYFWHCENIGMKSNFDFLAQKGTGKYFVFLADDDTWSSDYLESAVNVMEQRADVVSVSGETYNTPPEHIEETSKERIKQYFSGRQHPFHFYTLKPTWVVRKYTPFKRCISFDSIFQAQCLKEGKMITLNSVRQNYSREGASKTTEGQIKVLGYPVYFKYLIAIDLLWCVLKTFGFSIALVLVQQKWWWRELVNMGAKRFLLNLIIGRNTLNKNLNHEPSNSLR